MLASALVLSKHSIRARSNCRLECLIVVVILLCIMTGDFVRTISFPKSVMTSMKYGLEILGTTVIYSVFSLVLISGES